MADYRGKDKKASTNLTTVKVFKSASLSKKAGDLKSNIFIATEAMKKKEQYLQKCA
jgi:hypothetical protein